MDRNELLDNVKQLESWPVVTSIHLKLIGGQVVCSSTSDVEEKVHRQMVKHFLQLQKTTASVQRQLILRTANNSSMDESFLISDDTAVEAFLRAQIDRLQQLTCKKIAKAWIRGLCPHKQAKFPYALRVGDRKSGPTSHVPGWWPIATCRFIEPDHSTRLERRELLFNLLTLRASPAQMKAWDKLSSNDKHQFEPNKVHCEIGWTSMLRDITPVSVHDHPHEQKPERVSEEKDRLSHIFKIAEYHEMYKLYNANGDMMVSWPIEAQRNRCLKREREIDTPQAKKKARQISTECLGQKRTITPSGVDEGLMKVEISTEPPALANIDPTLDDSRFAGYSSSQRRTPDLWAPAPEYGSSNSILNDQESRTIMHARTSSVLQQPSFYYDQSTSRWGAQQQLSDGFAPLSRADLPWEDSIQYYHIGYPDEKFLSHHFSNRVAIDESNLMNGLSFMEYLNHPICDPHQMQLEQSADEKRLFRRNLPQD